MLNLGNLTGPLTYATMPFNMTSKPKILVILGPTASGKTALAIKLAKQFSGEVISADSRQIYKGMGIATGTPKGTWRQHHGGRAYFVSGVPHYLVDCLKPNQSFSVADFKNRATRLITKILKRGKLPIIVGGTGLYIWSLVDNLKVFPVKPNIKLRLELEVKSLPELVSLLKASDSKSANVVDLKNKRRVVRALELIAQGKNTDSLRQKGQSKYIFLQIGLKFSRPELYKRIDVRIEKQIKAGLAVEAKTLLSKYPLTLPSMSGIGYKEVASYLNGQATLEEAALKIKINTHRYAKRQETWFKRDKQIIWFNPKQPKLIYNRVREFLEVKN